MLDRPKMKPYKSKKRRCKPNKRQHGYFKPGMGPPEPDMRPHRCLIIPGQGMGPPGPGMGPPGRGMGPYRYYMGPGPNMGPRGPGDGLLGPGDGLLGPGDGLLGPGPSIWPPGQNMGIPGMRGFGMRHPGMPPLPPHVMPQSAMPEFSKQPPNMQPMQPNSVLWVEHMTPTGKVYYYDAVTRISSWRRPENACIVRQAEFENIHNAAQGLIDTVKSTCLPPSCPHLTDNTSEHSDEVCNKSQPEEAPPEWTQWRAYKNPSGRAYYYNICTQESVWDKPQVLLDFEEKLRMAGVSQAQTSVQQKAAVDTDDSTDESEEEVVEESKKQPEAIEEKEPEQTPEPKTEPKPVNKSRPVARIAIPGTVWYLVRTSDGRCFFYDPSKRHSAWERPEELKNRLDVDKLLSLDVDKLLSHKPEVTTEDKEEKDVQEEPPSKKMRSETGMKEVKKVNKNEVAQQTVLGKEAATKVEAQVAQQKSVVSTEVRMKQFRELLAEKNISAHARWEKELHKIALDERYLLLTSRERRQVFEEYVKDRTEEEDNQKHQKINEEKELCRQLLEESNLNKYNFQADMVYNEYQTEFWRVKVNDFMQMLSEIPGINSNSTWSDVRSKVSSDPRFKAAIFESRRENYFKEYLKTVNNAKSDDIGTKGEQGKKPHSSSLKEKSESRQYHREKVIADFKQFLAEKVTHSEDSYDRFKSLFHTNPIWKVASPLVDTKKLYNNCVNEICEKNRAILWSTLDQIKLSSIREWDTVKEEVQAHPRFLYYTDSEQKCEKEYNVYMRKKFLKELKEDFKELLKETEHITPETKSKLQQGSITLKDIECLIQNDNRYIALACINTQREQMLRAYINELSKKNQPSHSLSAAPVYRLK